LLEAMILIAALAMGLPRTLSEAKAVLSSDYSALAGNSRFTAIWYRSRDFCRQAMVPWLATSTLGVTVVALRRYRLDVRGLFRSPGVAVCVAATLGMAMGVSAGAWNGGYRRFDGFWQWLVADLPWVAGGAVLGAWLVLAIGGRRRAERDGLDWIGRALGICWVVTYLLTYDSL
jgi:hypothetical protein